MKNLRIHTVCVCLMLMSFCSFVQAQNAPPLNEPDYNKPRLFDNLPAKIPVNIDNVSSLFNNAIGANVDLGLSDIVQFQLNGELISTTSKSNGRVQKVVIRSANYAGAAMTISKITKEDGSVLYHGRILSLKHGDLFELQKETEGYVLVKRNYYDLVNE